MTGALGIDLGGTSVKAALLLGGAPAWERRSDPYARPDAEALRGVLRAVLRDLPADLPRATALGLCAPGLVDVAGVLTRSVNLPGLVGLDVRAILRDVLPPAIRGAPISLVTDAHAAAFDYWTEARPPGRLLALSLGTGVGACVLDDGVPLRVSGESPGHFGQVQVSDLADAPRGPDGARGTLEAFIGLPALRRRFDDRIDAALAGLSPDDAALRALAHAVRIAHAVYRPAHVALLGGVGIRLRPHLPGVHAAIADGLTSLARDGWTLACGRTEFHAARGAARLAIPGAAPGPRPRSVS